MSTEIQNSEVRACRVCGQAHEVEPLQPGMVEYCSRCGAMMERRSYNSLHMTAAFSLAALILYVPANILPILHLDMYGAESDNTVWEGCKLLWKDGDVIVAAIVFMASILIPLLKLLGLFSLVVFARRGAKLQSRKRLTWIYQIIESIGRWAMLDVFVLAVLVSVVKLHKLATVLPGKGLLAFTCVVVCTLIASASFDPQLIWEEEEGTQ
jgi:paraquat-inducible protein A